MNVSVREIKDTMVDMYEILKDRTWKGAVARTLLSADIIMWSLLIYFIVDYQLHFVR